jgi:hypothetical protein
VRGPYSDWESSASCAPKKCGATSTSSTELPLPDDEKTKVDPPEREAEAPEGNET